MIVDHILSGRGFALALTNMGELYQGHLDLARHNATLRDWRSHMRAFGLPAYARSVGEPFAITRREFDDAAERIAAYYAERIAEGA